MPFFNLNTRNIGILSVRYLTISGMEIFSDFKVLSEGFLALEGQIYVFTFWRKKILRQCFHIKCM